MLTEIKPHESYDVTLRGVFGFFAYESAVLREVAVRGVSYREKILISRVNLEIRRELIRHSDCEGRIVARAAPLAVQNPMTPVDLQFVPELTPTASRASEYALWLEEMLVAIRDE